MLSVMSQYMSLRILFISAWKVRMINKTKNCHGDVDHVYLEKHYMEGRGRGILGERKKDEVEKEKEWPS